MGLAAQIMTYVGSGRIAEHIADVFRLGWPNTRQSRGLVYIHPLQPNVSLQVWQQAPASTTCRPVHARIPPLGTWKTNERANE